jgi:hypothetical protein
VKVFEYLPVLWYLNLTHLCVLLLVQSESTPDRVYAIMRPSEYSSAMQVQYIPDDLIGIKAYHLWKDAGEPDRADFSGDARRLLEQELRSGKTMQVRMTPMPQSTR